MDSVPETSREVSPLVSAALQLAARNEAIRLGLAHPKAAEILEATGVGRSRAYELCVQIPAAISALARPVGRPVQPKGEPSPDVTTELKDKVIAYLIEHPGSVTSNGRRRNYSDGYRRFVLEQVEEHNGLDYSAVADAVAVPLPTLRDWLRGERPGASSPDDETIALQDAASAQIETVIHEWKRWRGKFTPFCEHLREHCRIDWGRTLIANVLEKAGVRLPRRRRGRKRDDGTLRDAFETFFPGAQWEGDGSQIKVRIGASSFTFNMELMVDADSDALVGLSIGDAEDSSAVVEAFSDGVETTGSPPLAVELDGRPSNHSDEVDQGLGETMRIGSTPGRPQTNPHVEGAFGLFEQTAPALEVDAEAPREAARQIAALVLMTWARTLNHKPRVSRGGHSRVEHYREAEPTADEVKRALKALRDRLRRQERMLQSRRVRQDPVVRAVIDAHWERLGLDDPGGRVRDAISSFSLDAVLGGIAVFEGKGDAGTLPAGADARYLLGIVRHIAEKEEGQSITEALLRVRLESRDVMLALLVEASQELLASVPEPSERLRAVLDKAMMTDRQLDRLFWLDVAADLIVDQGPANRAELVRSASRRIYAAFAVPYWDRQAAVRFLARKVVPLV